MTRHIDTVEFQAILSFAYLWLATLGGLNISQQLTVYYDRLRVVVQLFCNVIAMLVSIRLNSFGAASFQQASMKQQVYPRLRTIITVDQEVSDRDHRNCDPQRFCCIIPRFIALLDCCISWSPSKVPWPQLPACEIIFHVR